MFPGTLFIILLNEQLLCENAGFPAFTAIHTSCGLPFLGACFLGVGSLEEVGTLPTYSETLRGAGAPSPPRTISTSALAWEL